MRVDSRRFRFVSVFRDASCRVSCPTPRLLVSLLRTSRNSPLSDCPLYAIPIPTQSNNSSSDDDSDIAFGSVAFSLFTSMSEQFCRKR